MKYIDYRLFNFPDFHRDSIGLHKLRAAVLALRYIFSNKTMEIEQNKLPQLVNNTIQVKSNYSGLRALQIDELVREFNNSDKLCRIFIIDDYLKIINPHETLLKSLEVFITLSSVRNFSKKTIQKYILKVLDQRLLDKDSSIYTCEKKNFYEIALETITFLRPDVIISTIEILNSYLQYMSNLNNHEVIIVEFC